MIPISSVTGATRFWAVFDQGLKATSQAPLAKLATSVLSFAISGGQFGLWIAAELPGKWSQHKIRLAVLLLASSETLL